MRIKTVARRAEIRWAFENISQSSTRSLDEILVMGRYRITRLIRRKKDYTKNRRVIEEICDSTNDMKEINQQSWGVFKKEITPRRLQKYIRDARKFYHIINSKRDCTPIQFKMEIASLKEFNKRLLFLEKRWELL